ncbi:MAG: Asp-tRNA(Asn)/Glu-tRNA(Gln) amidotransferase subunit GatC [Anaerolineaceae bacterium]|nr:Asp-tRNA(Asn)/Glu-tRNA(Gln) amidotransferase subunit GatC [Anaerolineaceae bacterium]MBN2677373.1 Asp-tRNA(Asn)/Glu-tRNA(Gln) amidotransferase subunit GatC [Anaerolineaceae bacterium]
MELTPDIVKRIADLARLELTETEVELYCVQLSAILEYAARLQKIDTHEIPPTSSILPSHSLLREDDPVEGHNREEILKNAPAIKREQYQVPPILD